MQFLLLHMLGHCAYLANTIDSIWFLNISIEPNPKLPINIGRSFLFCSFRRPLIVCMVVFFLLFLQPIHLAVLNGCLIHLHK